MKSSRIAPRVLIPVALGAATLIGFGAGALLQPGSAGAADTTTTTTPSDASKPATDPAKCDHDGRGPGPGQRRPLDDATAAKVKAAALEAVPGATVDKVGHDRGSDGYMAVLTKADGTTRVLVHEDKNFKVTKVEDPAPPRPERPTRGPGRGPGGYGRGDGTRGPKPIPSSTPAA
jgi:hypothetical protein